MVRHFKAEVCKTRSHPTRVRMLNALDAGGLTARTLREKLEMGQSTASQHLAASQAEKFVVSRRDGSSIWHRVSERLIWQLLDVARDLYERQPLAEPSKL